MKKSILIIILFTLAATLISAQDTESEVPDRFGQIILGMSLEEVKDRLKADTNFNFRGDPDLSILGSPSDSLIDCRGYDFIERAFFQFTDDRLYTITIILNKELLDHYSLFTALSDKYGIPDYLDPQQSLWKSETNILSLERPLQVKYIDTDLMNGIVREDKMSESLEEMSREQFLEQF